MLDRFSIDSILALLLSLPQVYLLLLWTMPREIWNFIGGAIWFIFSVISSLIPSLPFGFDNLAVIAAIFGFIFLYLNTIAAIIQRIVDRRVVTFFRQRMADLAARIFQAISSKFPKDSHE